MTLDIEIDVKYHLKSSRPLGSVRKDRTLRKSNLEAAQTREAIVAAAADHIRRTGIAEASLADVMAAAGLPEGGVFGHFPNKDPLGAEASPASRDKTVATISRTMSKGGVNAAADSYLSTSHRDG